MTHTGQTHQPLAWAQYLRQRSHLGKSFAMTRASADDRSIDSPLNAAYVEKVDVLLDRIDSAVRQLASNTTMLLAKTGRENRFFAASQSVKEARDQFSDLLRLAKANCNTTPSDENNTAPSTVPPMF